MLGALLLCHVLFFLGDDLCLVFKGEGEGQPDEEGGGGDDPDDISDDLAGLLYEGSGLGNLCGDVVSGGRGDDVNEGSEPVIEVFVLGELRGDRGEGLGRGRARRRRGRVGRVLGDGGVLFLDDFDFDHGRRVTVTVPKRARLELRSVYPSVID